jgi:4,5-DOPA dioxygenase extradiol
MKDIPLLLRDLKTLSEGFKKSRRMPVLFIGHGSPMNGIESNSFSNLWEQIGSVLPRPEAVLCISAHWLTKGTFVTAMNQPKTIHDFGGFPPELYAVQYPAPGKPELAGEIKEIVQYTQIGLDHDWGLDHGTWSVVRRMFPEADIPVLQLSIDYYKPGRWHFDLAGELISLRDRGVLIIGSGNMVHNLRMVDFDKLNIPGYGYDWSIEMNDTFKNHIMRRDYAPLIEYERLGAGAKLAIPTPDHYWPLIYTLAATHKDEQPVFFNDELMGGSLTMTSVLFSNS